MESTTEIFLRVQHGEGDNDVVSGEAQVGRYAGRMQIDSFTFGMNNPLQAPGLSENKDANKLNLDRLVVTKFFDRASTQLAALMKRKEPLEEVRVTVDQQLIETGTDESRGSKAQNAILVFHLAGARVVDFKIGVTEEKAGATVKETVAFTFQQVSIDYYFTSRDKKQERAGTDFRDKAVSFDSKYQPQD